MRPILLFLFCALFVACSSQTEVEYPPLIENTDQHKEASKAPFFHGVASGDPLPNAVIIWTRVTPETQLPSVKVNWEISTDESFQQLAREGQVITGPEKDYTVKVDAKNLEPGTQYFYRFMALDGQSDVGQTKTTPEDLQEINFAVVSCSNYEFGYFNGFGAISEENDLDAVLHLGDYIYEYAPGDYGDSTTNRIHIPAKEIIELQDYRDRYAQYRLDPDLQAAHSKHPFILVWDDHEITNNSYKDGAQNHQEDEGPYNVRKDIAVQVYYEWMPVRESGQLYRSFSFGDQVDLFMLDERLAGRTKQADSITDPTLYDETRTMLGQKQLNWFQDKLKSSTANWKVIGNQVIFSKLNWGRSEMDLNLDSWDGYPVEQEKIANLIQENGISDVVFVTGDTHSSWAFEVTHDPDNYNPQTSEGAYALEFGTTSINSGNFNERFTDEEVLAHEAKIVNTPVNPHLKYSNMRDHGYLLIKLSDDQVEATWKYMKTLKERDRTFKEEVRIEASRGTAKLDLE